MLSPDQGEAHFQPSFSPPPTERWLSDSSLPSSHLRPTPPQETLWEAFGSIKPRPHLGSLCSHHLCGLLITHRGSSKPQVSPRPEPRITGLWHSIIPNRVPLRASTSNPQPKESLVGSLTIWELWPPNAKQVLSLPRCWYRPGVNRGSGLLS